MNVKPTCLLAPQVEYVTTHKNTDLFVHVRKPGHPYLVYAQPVGSNMRLDAYTIEYTDKNSEEFFDAACKAYELARPRSLNIGRMDVSGPGAVGIKL